ncbi:SIS domain-containing protein [Bradyrhizobium sp. AUGA SZCCT0240]|uniref:SIS domain-containing protein n=1 Tax=Bradyrhizobium sp. AUGA SZCCT0240 TaxID=2807669 RepID=UPI001BAC1869|nr:SIS domain-containing protein [Bradyrhizobium sp. AUGA SZCCT0240]MBR1257989.1 SIS domain-containing protein [Bradyrhizobium sp. AUGA SZCCT0240]
MTATAGAPSITASIRAEIDVILVGFARLSAQSTIERAAGAMIAALAAVNKIMFCGNGGSAADRQHLAAELMGRYLKDREPLSALTVDTSALRAIGNDCGYLEVFARRLHGVGRHGNVLVALSTSGNSPIVIAAIEAARTTGIVTVGMIGTKGGRMDELYDILIKVPATRTNRIREMHIAVGRKLCDFVEDALC